MTEPYTMHELSKTLHIPYASFHRTVQDMKDLLTVKAVGRAKTLQLRKDNAVLASHLAVASDEARKAFLKKHKLMRWLVHDMKATNEIVLLFGSYASGRAHGKSDVDILVINQKGNKTVHFGMFERLYKKTVNPMFFTRAEFKGMLRDEEENVGKQALKNHIVLNNPEAFWRLVLDAVR